MLPRARYSIGNLAPAVASVSFSGHLAPAAASASEGPARATCTNTTSPICCFFIHFCTLGSADRVHRGTRSLCARPKYPRRRLSERGCSYTVFFGHPCPLAARIRRLTDGGTLVLLLRRTPSSGRKLPQRSPGRRNLEWLGFCGCGRPCAACRGVRGPFA